MTTGRVNRFLEVVIAVGVEDASGTVQFIEVVMDTGFTGDLVLPQGTIGRLGLRFVGRRSVILAGGERSFANAFTALVHWRGRRRNAIVLDSASESLLGMSLLEGSKVTMNVQIGGSVLIEET